MEKNTLVAKPFIDKIIGAVQINKPQEHLKNNYECAAWWEKHLSLTGVYPVYLRCNWQHPYDLRASAQIPAKVTDDYFPALFCGVSYGKTTAKYIGQDREITVSTDFVDAVDKSGRCDVSAEIRWCIFKEFWEVALQDAHQRFAEARVHMLYWDKLLDSEEDRKMVNIGMVGYIGSELRKYAKQIELTDRHIEFTSREYNQKNFEENTAWASPIREKMMATV